MEVTGKITTLLQILTLSQGSELTSQLFDIKNDVEPQMSIQHTPLAEYEVSSSTECAIKCQMTKCCLTTIIKKITIADDLKLMCYLHDIFYPVQYLQPMPGAQYLHKTPVNGTFRIGFL